MEPSKAAIDQKTRVTILHSSYTPVARLIFAHLRTELAGVRSPAVSALTCTDDARYLSMVSYVGV